MMKAWRLHKYGKLVDLQLCETRIPNVFRPNQVLVRVQSVSINPIDIAMIDGYGSRLLNFFRCQPQFEFPLTLGRDFSGHIAAKGQNVSNQYQIGDAVYGVVPVQEQGSHAEFVLVNESNIHLVPKNHDLINVAAIPYASMTAWSSLWITAGLGFVQNKSLRVLVLGASGGVGSFALQMLKAYGHSVDGVCSTAAQSFVHSLGANKVFDYLQPNFFEQIEQEDFYDIILDCSKVKSTNEIVDDKRIENWKFRTFVTLNSPLLRNIDKNGLVMGTLQSGFNLLTANLLTTLSRKKTVRWAYFVPFKSGLLFVNDLLTANKIRPVIDKVYDFDKVPEAFEHAINGHVMGKVLVSFSH